MRRPAENGAAMGDGMRRPAENGAAMGDRMRRPAENGAAMGDGMFLHKLTAVCLFFLSEFHKKYYQF